MLICIKRCLLLISVIIHAALRLSACCQDRTAGLLSCELQTSMPTFGHQGALFRSYSEPSGAVSARFCTRACWLAQTPTWHWALTNGVWGDRELLLRHFRGLGEKKRERQKPVSSLFPPFRSSPLCLGLSPCTQGPTALPAFYWLPVAERSGGVERRSRIVSLWRPSLVNLEP